MIKTERSFDLNVKNIPNVRKIKMDRTVCELFAGVGGFRCGLNGIDTLEDINKPEKWDTVWFSQWEPSEKTTQYAHDCYVHQFGTRMDLEGNDTTNYNIEEVDKNKIPDFNLLVGGFPCQDYSVASSLATSKGLEGKKGVLWWSIREILEVKKPPFVLLENVDRLIKSPAKQRGRDFSVMLKCFQEQDYIVEWRVINAAEYGYQQRRRRVFIFAYKKDTQYAKTILNIFKSNDNGVKNIVENKGFFGSTFSIEPISDNKIKSVDLPEVIGEVSDSFSYHYENTGFMNDGKIYTVKTVPNYTGKQLTLGDMLEEGPVDKSYFIPEDKLYYTDPEITKSNEIAEKLPKEKRQTWQYLKGAKKLSRVSSTTGYKYNFSEGAISMIDDYDKPARTMLTSEGSFSRTTHIVKDKQTGKIRFLTPEEAERIQGFPTGHTKYCLVNGEVIEMPSRKRRFMMGNALVVNLIKDMEKTLDNIFENE